MHSRPIRVAIADDHEFFRDGFKGLFKKQQDLELVGEAGNGKELLELVTRLQTDVVITDIKMPEMDGIEVCKQIRKKFPRIKVIALSMFNDEDLIVDMLEAGATGYLLKNTNKNEVITATRAVYEGQTYYCNATSDQLAKMIADSKFNPYRNHPVPKFTARETEIINLICKQHSSKEIAGLLDLSIRTVESHRENIQEKTGAKNSIGIVIYAIKHHIVQI
jgi:DNA-binding NarL/FixJ family response regulator